MGDIEVFSGTVESILTAKPFTTGTIELSVVNDASGEAERISGTSKETFRAGCRINAIGQWREVRRQSQRERYFYAAGIFPVPHLLDVDETWIDNPIFTAIEKRQLLDASCILQQMGVRAELARKLSMRHKNRLLMRLITTPFKILEEEGDLPFDGVDTFAKSLGLAPTTADRAAAGIRDILSKAQEQGQTSLPLKKLKEIAIKQYFIFWTVADEFMNNMVASGAVSLENDPDDVVQVKIKNIALSKSTSSEVRSSSGNPATDLLLLRERDETFVWEEVLRTVSDHLQCPLKGSPHLVLIIDTSQGSIPVNLSQKINTLVERVGSTSLHCSAVTPIKRSNLSALDRYLVGLDDQEPELIIVEDAHLLDFRKIQFLAQRLKSSEGVILLGDGNFQSEKNEPNPLRLLISSQKIPTVKIGETCERV